MMNAQENFQRVMIETGTIKRRIQKWNIVWCVFLVILVIATEVIADFCIKSYVWLTTLSIIENTVPLVIGILVLVWSLIRIRQQSKLIPNAKVNQNLVIVHIAILLIAALGQV